MYTRPGPKIQLALSPQEYTITLALLEQQRARVDTSSIPNRNLDKLLGNLIAQFYQRKAIYIKSLE